MFGHFRLGYLLVDLGVGALVWGLLWFLQWRFGNDYYEERERRRREG